MNKLTFLVLFLIAANTFAQKRDTIAYYTDLDLKPVKKEKAKIIFKLVQTDSTSWTFLRYDSKNVIEVKETYADLNMSNKHGQYVVYSDGKPSLKGLYINNMKHGNFVSYNSEGKVVGVTTYNLDTLKLDVIYWQNGTKREEKVFGENNKIVKRLVYYDNGSLAVKQTYAPDNKLILGEYFDMEGKPAKIEQVEAGPTYPGGVQKFYEFIARDMRYPTDASQANIQGSVLISFVIDVTGEVTDVKVSRGLYPSLDREAVRVMESSPKWIPAKFFGKNVSVKYTIPIKFSLNYIIN